MALDKDRLGNAIVDSLEAVFPEAVTAASDATLRQMWKIVADEIIKEFLAYAEIEIQSFTAVAPGVSTGAGTSANITGTAEGIIQA